MKNLKGKVLTVLGPIEPKDLGVTLTHEHLFEDTEPYFRVPEAASERSWMDAPLTMDRLGGIARRWFYTHETMHMYDVDVATKEASRYKNAGGRSLVEVTPIGSGRDPLALARVSRATGLHIAMGGSYYVPVSHPPDMDRRSQDSITDQIVRDIAVGVGDTGIRSGIIGEVGCVWPMTDNATKVLRASAHAQKATGAPMTIHPGFYPTALDAIMAEILKVGVNPRRVIMGHLDFFHDIGLIKAVAETGCYLEFDTFGLEDTSYPPQNAVRPIDRSTDNQRFDKLEALAADGLLNRVVIAHDVCWTYRYSHKGGKTYDHILDNVVPRLRKRGFTEAQVRTILVDNPKTVLTFDR